MSNPRCKVANTQCRAVLQAGGTQHGHELRGHRFVQVNARCINDEPNVLDGFFDNRLFLLILGSELALQVSS